MAKFVLMPKQEKTLEVVVGDNSYYLPLRGSLPMKEVKTLGTPEGTYAFFKKQFPEDVFESLSYDNYNELVALWSKESDKASGMKLGES